MIHHVVLFRFRADAGDDQIAAAGEALLEMKGRIPAVSAVRWGRNLAPSSEEWPWVLVVECRDMDAVVRYMEHPVHREIVERYLVPIREARLAIDHESG